MANRVLWSLYLMLVRDSANSVFVKIGISGAVDKRVLQVQTGCPHPVAEVRHVFMVRRSDAQAAEKQIHERMKPFHSAGEWFRVSTPEAKALLNATLQEVIPAYAGLRHTWIVLTQAQLRELAKEASAVAREEQAKIKKYRRNMGTALMVLGARRMF